MPYLEHAPLLVQVLAGITLFTGVFGGACLAAHLFTKGKITPRDQMTQAERDESDADMQVW